MHSIPAYGSTVDTVYNGRLFAANDNQLSSRVSVVKLDWESVSDSDLSTVAAAVDCIIATGLVILFVNSRIICLPSVFSFMS